jgi:hypothetical protein
MYKYLSILVLATFLSCTNSNTSETSAVGEGGWLSGSDTEKFEEIAHQLGGFSRTMIEVSYRYSELYWAGKDQNWQYADHQLEHLLETLEDGLKRRPIRAESAEDFLKNTIPEMQSAIEAESQEVFMKGFQTLTSGCNACHAKEGESFIQVQIPEIRVSPIRK